MLEVESNLEAEAARMVKLDAQRAIDAHIAAGTIGDAIDETKQFEHRLDRRIAMIRWAQYVQASQIAKAKAGLGDLSFRDRLLFDGGVLHALAATDAVVVWSRWVDHQRPVTREYAADGTYVDKHGAPDINVAIGKMSRAQH